MSIQYAILGLLSWKPSTGYDIKKVFVDSSSMYWSGNNNQIYKSLVQLSEEGLVTNEVLHFDNAPSKKVYTITSSGRLKLKEWIMSAPEPPDMRKTFLIQIAWADQLGRDELDGLLSRYEEEVRTQILIQREKSRRGAFSPKRTLRESYIWEMISENIVSSYENELDWVRRLKKGLAGMAL